MHRSEKIFLGWLFLGAVIIVAAVSLLVKNPPDRDYPTPPPPSRMDQVKGQCYSDQTFGPYVDINNDSKVDCANFGDGGVYFVASTKEEALSKRRAYLHYMIDFNRMSEGYFKSPDDAKRSIYWCRGDLYLVSGTCENGERLPNPYAPFPRWITSDSEYGKSMQREFDRLALKYNNKQ